MAKADLTAQRLGELLDYNPETGEFRWKGRRRGAPKNRNAGCINSDGYRAITCDGRLYLAHRLAWLFMTGNFPRGMIDHINGAPLDNRFINLRDVDSSTNRQNLRRATFGSRSGLLGVVWDASRSKWEAIIYVNKKRIHLGRFASPQAAHEAHVEAKRRLHPGCTI